MITDGILKEIAIEATKKTVKDLGSHVLTVYLAEQAIENTMNFVSEKYPKYKWAPVDGNYVYGVAFGWLLEQNIGKKD